MSNSLIYYVYAYIRSNGTPYYIGKGKGGRAFVDHGRVTVPKDRNKIVFLEKNLTEVGAFALERRMIRWWGRKDHGGILLNLTEGGDGAAGRSPWNKGKQLSQDIRTKISEGGKGVKRSDVTRQKMKLSNKRLHTEEAKAKMSAARKGIPKPKLVCRLEDRKEMTLQNFSAWITFQSRKA
jgi:hypothetical protein